MSSEQDKATAEGLKTEANKLFVAHKYKPAVELYNQAIDLDPSNAVLYSNRSFAQLKMENFGSAIMDATKCLELDPTFVKGYYRRGSANLALSKFDAALKDFAKVVALVPRDADARAKYNECNKAVTRARFEAAISGDHDKKLVSETLNPNDLVVESSYNGVHLPETITLQFVKALMDDFKNQKKIHKKYLYQMLIQFVKLMKAQPTLVDITIPESGAELTICGDVHGQYYDLLNIFNLNGMPSEKNWYLFNGDFVDRGSFSCEVVIALFALKLLYPTSFFLARGNHETRSMNRAYGFEGEVRAKYSDTAYELFQEAFCALPLVHLVNKKILVVHGGLPGDDKHGIAEIRKVERNREPPQEGLMADLLWADPQPISGRSPSKRGVGFSFGPDVTHRFMKENDLSLIVRSHEVKQKGYEIEADGKLVTVFSAPNYCDQVGNQGAYIRVAADLNPIYTSFDAVPHPNVPPMAYASSLFSI